MTFSLRKAQIFCAATMLAASQAVAAPSSVQLAALEPKPDLGAQQEHKQLLAPEAQEIAEIMGIMPLVEQLIALRQKGAPDRNAEFDELKIHVKLSDSTLIAGLEVRDVTARIEREIARISRLRGYLEDKRDRAIRYNSMANVFGTGVIAEIGQAGEMKVNEIPGETTELVGGGIAMLLSGLALRQQSGGKQRADLKPNMLSEVLGRSTNKDTQLPPLVWNYLNRTPPDAKGGQTRLQGLLQQWRRYRLIGNMNSPDGKRRAVALSNTGSQVMMNIDLCEDEIALLSDLKAEIYQIDRQLLELLISLQKI
jgi:hypothetical protein